MASQRWTEYDARMGYCLKSEVGQPYEGGTRPAAPVYWTQGAYSRGECLAEQVGTRIAAPERASADESTADVDADETVARLLDAAASLHLQTPEEQRAAQLQYLNLGIAALLPRVSAGDRLSMETMVRLQARVASISGLDQPRIRGDRPVYQTRDIPRLSDEELMVIAAGGIAYRTPADVTENAR